MRFLRAYSALLSITLLAAMIPSGIDGVVHFGDIQGHYDNTIEVDGRMWLMLAGFVAGVILVQRLDGRPYGDPRVRTYRLSIALFLGLWLTAGLTFALATAEWTGLWLAISSLALAPLAPWTDVRGGFAKKVLLTGLALAAVVALSLSSSYFLDSGFLFMIFTAPLAALSGALGIAGAEKIMETEARPRVVRNAQADAIRQLRSCQRSVV